MGRYFRSLAEMINHCDDYERKGAVILELGKLPDDATEPRAYLQDIVREVRVTDLIADPYQITDV